MSCNPAIGGQSKGQIVREIDALGGEMALNADASAIQYKLLNTSRSNLQFKHPVHNVTRKYISFRMKHILELTKNLNIFQVW